MLSLAMLVLIAGTELLARPRAAVESPARTALPAGPELLATTNDGGVFLSAWLQQVETCRGIERGKLGAASVAELRSLVNLQGSRWTEFRALHAQIEQAVYGRRADVDSFRQRAIDQLAALDLESQV